MNRILILIFLTLLSGVLLAEKSPHGPEFRMDCAVCHQTDDWKNVKKTGFDHNKTKFPLTGHHQDISCRSCHKDLSFEIKDFSCVSCHKDFHEQTLGDDCDRCHQTTSWLIPEVKSIHRNAGFPLNGIHATLDCNQCHNASSGLRFERISTDCYSCHQDDYFATSTPNHTLAGFGKSCTDCHVDYSNSWSASYSHDFFPLQGGHQIACNQCHKTANQYKGLSTDCMSCHQSDYENSTNPPHVSSGFSTDCKTCHTIQGWTPATFDHDKLYFPIYSGKHKGEWSNCNECHSNSNNYADFSCTICHEHSKSRMDSKHDDVHDYVYNSQNCYSCHPKGRADD